MTHGEGGDAHAHCPSSSLRMVVVYFQSITVVYGKKEFLFVSRGTCCYVVELGTVDGACSCVGLSQVATDGDCHPATYDSIEHSQPAVTAKESQPNLSNMQVMLLSFQ